MIDGPYLHCTANIHYYLIVPWLSWDRHGIMGTPMPNKFSYIRPHPDSKYTTYDHTRTANIIPTGDWSAEIS